MTEPRIYFPVGRSVSTEELRQYSDAQLENRDLNDPRFAGFDRNFNWRDYISVGPDMPDTVRANIEQSLDQIASTPEGQHTLRQAYAMQHARDQEARGPHVPPRRISIALTTSSVSEADIHNGTIRLRLSDIENGYFTDPSGNAWQYSFQHIIYHELCHMKDGMLTNANWDAWARRIGLPDNNWEWEDILSHLDDVGQHTLDFFRGAFGIPTPVEQYYEHPAIRETNQFMQRYYRQPTRVYHTEPPSLGYFFAELPPGLDADHSYDEMLTPSPTPAVPASVSVISLPAQP